MVMTPTLAAAGCRGHRHPGERSGDIRRNESGYAELTDYARQHIDECCLVFDIKARKNDRYSAKHYTECVLFRDVVSDKIIKTKSIAKPAIIPITTFIAKILNIVCIGTASDINIGSISSDVDK